MNELEPLTVYWAPLATLEREAQTLLLEVEPKSVLKDIFLQKNTKIKPWTNPAHMFSNGYHMCVALKDMAQNLFYIKAPFDVDVTFTNNGEHLMGDRADWFRTRHGSFNDSYSADFDFAFLLFAEEPLEVNLVPPYLHQTSQPEFGFVTAAGFDISKWFRPWILSFQLWPHKNRIHFKHNEPLAYWQFNTKRPIVFKQFKLTQTIIDIQHSCSGHKYIFPFQNLDALYRRFVASSLQKRVLAEIKNNLI